jgi:DNA-directed RNA polymerase sigma subunit (sigma70/sigma32)
MEEYYTYEEIAEYLTKAEGKKVTVRDVKAAEASALAKMRHPKNGKKLKEYMRITESSYCSVLGSE